MTSIDLDILKRISAKAGRRNVAPSLSSKTLRERQGELENFLKSYFEKTGLPMAELNKLRAGIQAERGRLFAAQLAENTKILHADQNGLRQAAANRQQALQILSLPFQPTMISLDEPFLIWEYPKLEQNVLINFEAAPYNSFAKILLDTNTGNGNSQFVFHFLWTNPNGFPAVVNVTTALLLNGSARVQTDTALLGGKANTLNMDAELQVLRYSGWGTDPYSGQSLDQTFMPSYLPSQKVTFPQLSPDSGSDLFGDAGVATIGFFNDQAALGYKFLTIPALATTVFEVSLTLNYEIQNGDDYDLVHVDFASGNDSVKCEIGRIGASHAGLGCDDAVIMRDRRVRDGRTERPGNSNPFFGSDATRTEAVSKLKR